MRRKTLPPSLLDAATNAGHGAAVAVLMSALPPDALVGGWHDRGLNGWYTLPGDLPPEDEIAETIGALARLALSLDVSGEPLFREAAAAGLIPARPADWARLTGPRPLAWALFGDVCRRVFDGLAATEPAVDRISPIPALAESIFDEDRESDTDPVRAAAVALMLRAPDAPAPDTPAEAPEPAADLPLLSVARPPAPDLPDA